MIHSFSQAAIVFAAAVVFSNAAAAEDLTVRTELHRADLTGAEGTEVIVSEFIVKPGGEVPLHTHPGDEHLVVTQGTELTTMDGTEIEFTDGYATSFPRGKVHGGVTNTSDKHLILTTIHIVDKDKPMFEMVQ